MSTYKYYTMFSTELGRTKKTTCFASSETVPILTLKKNHIGHLLTGIIPSDLIKPYYKLFLLINSDSTVIFSLSTD